jgi:endonuclease/exonuclease/phosphatase family metal-dependent hydrolase
VTEGFAEILPSGGHVIRAEADYGYPIKEGRRKVLLWSRQPWTEVDPVGSSELPSGRFVSGVTDTPLGRLRFIGVCIPWSAAHVSSGRRDRQRWEDHLAFVAGLQSILAHFSDHGRMVVSGDFNQRMPRLGSTVPKRVREALEEAVSELTVSTRGNPHKLIDHIAHTPDLATESVLSWALTLGDRGRASDHCGVVADLRSAR